MADREEERGAEFCINYRPVDKETFLARAQNSKDLCLDAFIEHTYDGFYGKVFINLKTPDPDR